MTSDLNDLKKKLIQFIDAATGHETGEDFGLSQAISIEASELLEHFLWVSQEDSHNVVLRNKDEIADEMADIFAYLLSLSDVTGIDLGEALLNKLEKNKEKYPADKVKGSSKKYTEYK